MLFLPGFWDFAPGKLTSHSGTLQDCLFGDRHSLLDFFSTATFGRYHKQYWGLHLAAEPSLPLAWFIGNESQPEVFLTEILWLFLVSFKL